MRGMSLFVNAGLSWYWYRRARRRGNSVGWSIAESLAVGVLCSIAGRLISKALCGIGL